MVEQDTADLITFILIAMVVVELIVIMALGIWRRLYLQRFTRASAPTTVFESRQEKSGSLRDTSAAPLHQKSDSLRNQRDK